MIRVVTIVRKDGSFVWEGRCDVIAIGSHVKVTIDAPLELVPDLPFVRLPKEEDPDA